MIVRTGVSGGQRQFKCFVSLEGGWGEYSQTGPTGLASGTLTLSCLWGTMTLNSLGTVTSAKTASATVGTTKQACTMAGKPRTFFLESLLHCRHSETRNGYCRQAAS